MSNKINRQKWLKLFEADFPPPAGQPDTFAGGPPMNQPGGPGNPMGDPSQQNLPPADMAVDPQSMQDDITDDPQYPDMPEDQESNEFEVWKIKYVKESIKGDPNTLIQKILKIRDRELTPYQRKFVEDNLDINFLRQNANILQASNEIRKLIKKDFDMTYPATAVLKHITTVLDQSPLLNEVYLKCSGLGDGKAGHHRKFIASLIGAVQVGSGGEEEDLIFEEQDYSIRLSTRFNARWGDVNIGRWYLKEDDPERFLKNAEIARLEGGSPEEKDVLRRRVVVESIAKKFLERAFIVNVVGQNGTVYHLGWDIGNSLRSAYLDGKLVLRTSDNDNREAFIDQEGSIISIPSMNIYYVKESGEMDIRGKPLIDEVEFISYRDGCLYLSAQLDLIKEASMTLQGMFFKETLFQGNQTDVMRITRCVPGASESILRTC